MSLLDRIRQTHQQAIHYTYVHIPPERSPDFLVFDGPVKADSVYIRITMAEMFVRDAMIAGKQVYPAFNSEISITSPGAQNEILIPYIVPLNAKQQAAPGVFLSFPLTTWLPFRGGDIRVESFLTIVEGIDYFDETLGVLSSLNDLVGGGAGLVLKAADILKGGIDKIFGAVEGTVRLSFARTFDASTLKQGYVAIIRDPDGMYQSERFGVLNDRLRYSALRLTDDGTVFDGADYMLLKIEVRGEHENWRDIPNLGTAYNEACKAYMQSNTNVGDTRKAALDVAIFESTALTFSDKKRVRKAAHTDLDECAIKESGITTEDTQSIEAFEEFLSET